MRSRLLPMVASSGTMLSRRRSMFRALRRRRATTASWSRMADTCTGGYLWLINMDNLWFILMVYDMVDNDKYIYIYTHKNCLVVEQIPLKNVSQLGWWHSQLNGKIKMFQTTNQKKTRRGGNFCYSWSYRIGEYPPVINHAVLENGPFMADFPSLGNFPLPCLMTPEGRGE